jgi:hypothetical protein
MITGNNGNKPHFRSEMHEAIVAIDNLFSKHKGSHLLLKACLTLAVYLLSIPTGGVSSNATLHYSDHSDNAFYAFMLIHNTAFL